MANNGSKGAGKGKGKSPAKTPPKTPKKTPAKNPAKTPKRYKSAKKGSEDEEESDNGGEGSSKAAGKKPAKTPLKSPPQTPKKSAKTPAKAPKKGKISKKAAEEEQESEGSGDEIVDNKVEESEGEEFSGSEEEYDSDLGLRDFVVPDSEVEEEEVLEEAENSVDRPDTGIEMEPDQEPQNDGFNIVRLIQYTDKGGADDACPIKTEADYFTVQYGDFLLDLSDLKTVDQVHVRNYYDQERFIPRRMLQSIQLPWGLPTTVKLDDENGVGLPVAFVGEVIPAAFGGIDFDEDETVMIKTPGDPTVVIDFERRVGEIKMRAPKIKRLVSKKGKEKEPFQESESESEEEVELLTSPCDFPWDLRVDPDWIDQYIVGKTPPKKGRSRRGKGKEKDNGEGSSKGPSKRKRDDEEEEPKPKPKKRATLTTVSKTKGESSKTEPTRRVTRSMTKMGSDKGLS